MTSQSGSFSGKATTQATISLSDTPDHQLNIAEIVGKQKSPDKQWNGAHLTYWGVADQVAGSGSQRGYFVNVHTDGDRDQGTFEGKVKASGNQLILEGTWTYTGGTGKLAGLKGSGSYKGRMTSPTEVEMEWKGEYEVGGAMHA